ncbi:MAG: serine/threonine protein kinase [Bryobacterales bacterium]|nr:serine/threonine protein kinase [Bryobacterales bacterium]
MTADDRAALDRVLDEALSLPPEQWEPLVRMRFDERPDLVSEARSLLEHADAARARLPAADEFPRPERAGPYRLVRELGRGGMGVVFLGERDDGRFEQRVAVKLLPPVWGLASSARLFDAERRILARLEHPHICHILDAGQTPEGWPFLAMELVDGDTLDKWLANAQPSERQRLAVFLQICDAVRYAHSNLVIHCDLKPRNILISPSGGAKLLDFGVAKLLAEQGETQPAARMATPKYASPEQLRGEPATTASDVYTLGLVLRETAGPSPAPDLQAIADKAAAPDPAMRYGSAAQLSDDIERYIAKAPVLAQRQTFGYVTSRLLARYKLEAGLAAVAAALLVAGLAGVLWQARVAGRERVRAVRHFENIRRLAGSLVFDLHDRIEKVPGALDAREALLRRGIEYLDILAKDAGSDPGVLLEAAQAYRRVARLQYDSDKPNRADLEGAIATLEKADAAARAATRLAPGCRDCQLELLRAMVDRTSRLATRAFHRSLPDDRTGRELAEEALRLSRRLAGEVSGNVETAEALGSAQFSLGATYESFNAENAINAYRDSLASFRQVLVLTPADPERRRNVARTARALGTVLTTSRKWTEAKPYLEEALEIDESLMQQYPHDSMRALNVTFDLSCLFTAAGRAGDWTTALPLAARMARIREEIVQRDPSDRNAEVRLWFAYTNSVAEALVNLNRPIEALAALERARAIELHLPKDVLQPIHVARARYNEGLAKELSGNRSAACALLRESGQLLSSVPRTPGTNEVRLEIEKALDRCGKLSPGPPPATR